VNAAVIDEASGELRALREREDAGLTFLWNRALGRLSDVIEVGRRGAAQAPMVQARSVVMWSF
jgi:hypothetical protein